jgi:hypothetical protein
MASDVVRPRDQRPAPGAPKGGAPAPGAAVGPRGPARLVQFYHDVLGEMKRVSWPDRTTLRDATLRIIVFVLPPRRAHRADGHRPAVPAGAPAGAPVRPLTRRRRD